jgi:hypothetical protein
MDKVFVNSWCVVSERVTISGIYSIHVLIPIYMRHERIVSAKISCWFYAHE